MKIYQESLALLTDLYQLTMAYGYWKAGIHERKASFYLHFRKWPFKGGFALTAGLGTVIDFIQKFQFSPSDLDYLASLENGKRKPLFEKGFLDFLARFSFACDIDAMTEGSLAFPFEPLLRVTGPLWQAQILESPLLNILNFQSLIATKSARICMAASPDPVIEFGMRRAQGIDGAISATRASFIGGCQSTSHVLAGKLFGIPVKGTHAHSWVMAFDDEEKAFEAFAHTMPHDCVLLVDTYHSIEAVKKVVRVAKKIENFELFAIRLDSGDLAQLSISIRKILDDAGLQKTQIMASNELDEYLIRDLKQQGAKITLWGVGTNLVTAKDQPALDGIYKLSAMQDEKGKWVHKMKLSDQTAKTTNPGILQVRRFFDGQFYVGDAIYDEILGIKGACVIVDNADANAQKEMHHGFKDILVPIFRGGKLVYSSPRIQDIRRHAQEELQKLPANMKRFINPQPYIAGLEKGLYRHKIAMIQELA